MPGVPAPETAWKVVTTRLFRPTARRIGSTDITRPVVVQLGFAMMPRCFSRASALISGTTRGTSSSIRQVLDLSITTAPRFTASGASSLESPPVAAKKTMSTPSKASGSATPTSISSPRNVIVLPADRVLASGFSWETGKRRSSSTRRRTSPTAPVAPTTATTTSFFDTAILLAVRCAVRVASTGSAGRPGCRSRSGAGRRRLGWTRIMGRVSIQRP